MDTGGTVVPAVLSAQSFPVRLLYGLYLGVLTGILPALVSWGLALLFRYVTGLSVPAVAVVVLAVAIAGVNGGFMAFNDPSVVQSTNNVTIVVALLVVMMVSFYAHNKGDELGASLPRHVTLAALRRRTLSADVVELVGGRGQVRVRVVGGVEDVEGYPPLSPPLRASIRESSWTFPADLPLSELEERVADRLRTEFDLADVSVSVDERARATVAAAPPVSGVSRRLDPGQRAVSVEGLVPTGVARGDEVTVAADDDAVTGTVVSVRADPAAGDVPTPAGDGGADGTPPVPASTPTTPGGPGRVTLAVARHEATALLRADDGRFVVRARGTRREYEFVSLLRRAGQRIRRAAVRDGGPLDGATIGSANVRERYGVVIVAARTNGEWTLAPRGNVVLAAGDDLFAVGSSDALDRFGEAVIR